MPKGNKIRYSGGSFKIKRPSGPFPTLTGGMTGGGNSNPTPTPTPAPQGRTLYFNSLQTTDIDHNWNNLNNWYTDSSLTIAATSIPTSIDSVVIMTNVMNNTGMYASVLNLNAADHVYINIAVGETAVFTGGAGNYGTITGNCLFNEFSVNFGTVTGNATFNDSSYNQGTVTGNATFTYLTETNGNVVDITGYANGNVGGLTKDSLGNTIISWTFNNTVNTGTVTGNAVFYDFNGWNDGVINGNVLFNENTSNNLLGVINGNAEFDSESYNNGTINGNATFFGQNYGANPAAGTISGTISFTNYPGYGCMDSAASNYNSQSFLDDGSCLYPGCTDPNASNYNPGANTDDGSCTYPAPSIGYLLVEEPYNNGDLAVTLMSIGDGFGGSDFSASSIEFSIDGNVWTSIAMIRIDYGIINTLSENISLNTTIYVRATITSNYSGLTSEYATATSFSRTINGCTDPNADNYNLGANTDDGSCYRYGCTDPGASNYDSLATLDNGNCEYPGCTDPNALNYNPSANVDDGSCTYE